jgi:DNA-binding NarL/FixJ family response regulator
MIRLCIADDQTLVRQGIRSLLQVSDEFTVAAEARDGRDALEVIRTTEIDVLLLDLRMPVLDGIGVLRALAGQPAPPTLVLTTFDDDQLVVEALRAGARGYLLKDVTLEQLCHAIRTLHTGGHLIQPAVTTTLVRHLEHHPPAFEHAPQPVPLTPRELDILRLVAGGHANREIAELLFLAEGTVKNHISSILGKLGARDRTRAVLRAITLGLIGPTDSP